MAPVMKLRRLNRAGFRDGDGGGKARILNDNGLVFAIEVCEVG